MDYSVISGKLKSLIAYQAPLPLDALCSDGRTALILAANAGPAQLHAVRQLASTLSCSEMEEMVLAKDGWGQTALMHAAAKGSSELLAALLQCGNAGAQLLARDSQGETALSLALQSGSVACVELWSCCCSQRLTALGRAF